MKSELFKRGFEEKFLGDVKLLARIPTEAFRQLISKVQETKGAAGVPADNELISISESSGFTARQLATALSVVIFIYEQVTRYKDSSDFILDDLLSSQVIDSDQVQNLREKLKLAESVMEKFIKQFQVTAAIFNSFPTLEHMHTRCSVATRFDPEFDRAKDTPSAYSPKVTTLTPVVVVQIDVNRYGETDRVAFALSEDGINEVINHLDLARVQLKTLAAYLPKKE